MKESAVTIDILSNPRYAGAIDSIRGLTDWIDAGFGMVITFVAFMIILVAMLKNVLAGAYVAFPKFWDAVDRVHQERKQQDLGWFQQLKQTFGGGQQLASVNLGTFSKMLLGIMPNIKYLTEFEDDTIRPKDYFVRAIPQMIGIIIIGAFIYNGYYRDVAAKVTDFGSEIVSRVLMEVDPIALYDQFTNTAGRPAFSTDNAATEEHKFYNQVAIKCYSTVIGTYTDITSVEAKSSLANNVETWVLQTVGGKSECSSLIGDDEWDPKVNVSLVLGEPDLSKMEGTSKDELVRQFAFSTPVSYFGISSTKEAGKDWHLRVIIQFQKQASSSGGSGSSIISELTLNMPLQDTSYDSGPGYLKGKATIETTDASGTKITAEIDCNTSGRITLTGANGTGTWEVIEGNIQWYESGGKPGKKITTVVISSSGDISLSSDAISGTFTIKDGPTEEQLDNKQDTSESGDETASTEDGKAQENPTT